MSMHAAVWVYYTFHLPATVTIDAERTEQTLHISLCMIVMLLG